MRDWKILLLVLVAALAVGCAGVRKNPGAGEESGRGAITIKGSDTMVILGQRWAENYMKATPGVMVQVAGGGSGTGIAALINGTTDIAEASRPMTDEEKRAAEERHGRKVMEIPTALDGVAIYLNASNPVKELTVAQIRDIYTGKVTRWSDVGGRDEPIVLYGRENNSGTYVFMKEHVLANADYAPQTQTLPGTAAVVNAVAKDPKGIGYGGTAYATGIKLAPIQRDPGAPAVLPSLETVRDGSYPLARKLYWYVLADPRPEVQAMIDWVLGPEGQKIVADVGYFPLN